MERLADKLVVLVACLPALVAAAGGTAGAGLVVALLAAVALAALCELARGRVALVPPLAVCALACALPEAAALLGVAAYDLCRVSAGERRCVRAVPAAALVPLAWGAARGVPDGRAVLLATVGVVVGGWLGLRVGASELRRRDALRTRDDLAAARLALAAMETPGRNVNGVAGGKRKAFFVDGEKKTAGYYMQQLHFRVPVIGHLVPGMIPVDEIILQGKIRGTALQAFMVAKRTHAFSP